jgi:hypothetical protein
VGVPVTKEELQKMQPWIPKALRYIGKEKSVPQEVTMKNEPRSPADMIRQQAMVRNPICTQPTYICPEDCQFFRGEDGCSSSHILLAAIYEKEGDYPVCPFYFKPLGELHYNTNNPEDGN